MTKDALVKNAIDDMNARLDKIFCALEEKVANQFHQHNLSMLL